MRNIIKLISIFSFLCIILAGCADKIVSEEDVNTVKLSQSIQLSKFSELQKNIFTPSCAIEGCHAGSNLQANMDLSEGKAYSNIVNKQSLLFPSSKRVVPGNKEQSLIYKGLSYTFNQLKMPPTGKISQYLIDSLGVWIDKGALND
jgi:hypothetical protein